jgi:hypothetical protein
MMIQHAWEFMLLRENVAPVIPLLFLISRRQENQTGA